MQILLSFLMSCSRCGSRNHFSYRWLLFLRSYTSYVYPFENDIFCPDQDIVCWPRNVVGIGSSLFWLFFPPTFTVFLLFWLESQSLVENNYYLAGITVRGRLTVLFRRITVNICEKHKFLQTIDILSNGIVLLENEPFGKVGYSH